MEDEKIKIRNVKRAIGISERAYLDILKFIKVGMTEKVVRDELMRLHFLYGAEQTAFDTIVAFSTNTANMHHTPTNKKLKDGDIAMLDFGCFYKGYCSDMTRTFFIGPRNEKNKKQKKLIEIYNIAYEALQMGVKKAGPGVACKDLDSTVRNFIEKHDYEFIHATGHGIGEVVHDNPKVSFKSEDVLKEGDIITIEPGIYVKGLGGVRIEEDVLITESGCKVLTQLPTKLFFM